MSNEEIIKRLISLREYLKTKAPNDYTAYDRIRSVDEMIKALESKTEE